MDSLPVRSSNVMGRVLGVDYGLRRIGLAVSDPEGVVAVPWRTVEVGSDDKACACVREACREREIQEVVLGLPLTSSGVEGAMAQRVRAFARRLNDELNLPVTVWDERLTTAEVERALISADVTRAGRKRLRDKLAACVLLQSFLDARRVGSRSPAGRGEAGDASLPD